MPRSPLCQQRIPILTSNSLSLPVGDNQKICSGKSAFKNLFFIRKTNGRIEQTMKIENARVNTKVLVATRAKRR